MPRPAATGTASARRPIRIASVARSISGRPFAFGALPKIPDLVLDLLLSRARADQLRSGPQLTPRHAPRRIDEDDDADRKKADEPGEPKQLRQDRRRLKRRLAARARGPRLLDNPPAMPSHQAEEDQEQDESA